MQSSLTGLGWDREEGGIKLLDSEKRVDGLLIFHLLLSLSIYIYKIPALESRLLPKFWSLPKTIE